MPRWPQVDLKTSGGGCRGLVSPDRHNPRGKTQAPDLAETRLKTSVGEFQRHLETGLIGAGKTGIKHGSAKVEIVAQGPTA